MCVANIHPNVMRNPSQTVNIAPADVQIVVSDTNEPDCEALAFRKEFLTNEFHFNLKKTHYCAEIYPFSIKEL